MHCFSYSRNMVILKLRPLMGRMQFAARNIFFGFSGHVVHVLLGFISRTVFIYTLGATYLGVNGLFTNVLSVLSLAELGIGTAMNFSLYKPAAEKDIEKIKALMNLYRRSYRIVAFVVTVLGFALVPFLHRIIKDPGNIGFNELRVYYLIFLFNTVSSYFVAYKYSIVNAEQRNYIQTNIHTITVSITIFVQIIVLVLLKNFLLYLLVGALIGLVQKFLVNTYLNRLYPYLLEKNVCKLPEQETETISKNIKALIYHKIGDMSVHQTDNIIISAFINVPTVGLISNYNLLITSISGFINIIFHSVVSGFGNLIATENREKQYFLFRVYRFVGFWLYGFASVAFFVLLTPFIQLWIGQSMVIEHSVISLILLNYYFMGHRIIINNFKTAAGIFDADKFIALVQAFVNLVLSVVLVQVMGLAGVYVGTVVSGLVSTFTRPVIVYRSAFQKNPLDYYKDSLKYLLVVFAALVPLELIKHFLWINKTAAEFISLLFLVVLITNGMFFFFSRKRDEFCYLLTIIAERFHGRGK